MADTLPQEVAEAIGALYMDGRLNLPNLDIVQSHLHRLAEENAEFREMVAEWRAKAATCESELAALRAFARDVLVTEEAWISDRDGDELQDLAIKHGLIRLKDPAPTEPCGEGCACAEYHGDMSDGVECYECTALLQLDDEAKS